MVVPSLVPITEVGNNGTACEPRPEQVNGRRQLRRRVAEAASDLLSILASHGHGDAEAHRRAWAAGMAELDLAGDYAGSTPFDYQRMNENLAALRKLKPLAKPALIKACAATVLADGRVSAAEGAMLQGIAATLDCPLPPSIYARTAA